MRVFAGLYSTWNRMTAQLRAHSSRSAFFETMAANAGFAYRFRRGVEIYGRLSNFLNQKYEESFGFPALRLNFVSGLKLELPAGRDRSSP